MRWHGVYLSNPFLSGTLARCCARLTQDEKTLDRQGSALCVLFTFSTLTPAESGGAQFKRSLIF